MLVSEIEDVLHEKWIKNTTRSVLSRVAILFRVHWGTICSGHQYFKIVSFSLPNGRVTCD